MLKESAELIPDYTVMQHLLSAVLAKLETDSKRDYLDNKASGTPRLITFNNFLRILDNNFRRAEGVEFYAEKLNMTARNLNLITRSVSEKVQRNYRNT